MRRTFASNLGSLLNDQILGDQRKYGLILACAHGTGYWPMVEAAVHIAAFIKAVAIVHATL